MAVFRTRLGRVPRLFDPRLQANRVLCQPELRVIDGRTGDRILRNLIEHDFGVAARTIRPTIHDGASSVARQAHGLIPTQLRCRRSDDRVAQALHRWLDQVVWSQLILTKVLTHGSHV